MRKAFRCSFRPKSPQQFSPRFFWSAWVSIPITVRVPQQDDAEKLACIPVDRELEMVASHDGENAVPLAAGDAAFQAK